MLVSLGGSILKFPLFILLFCSRLQSQLRPRVGRGAGGVAGVRARSGRGGAGRRQALQAGISIFCPKRGKTKYLTFFSFYLSIH